MEEEKHKTIGDKEILIWITPKENEVQEVDIEERDVMEKEEMVEEIMGISNATTATK